MVHFVGAGPGAPDLITLRGAKLLEEADVVIYAGSLVNPELLKRCKATCETHNSAYLTLEQVLAIIERAEAGNKATVRLHTGDTAVYSTIREQMDALEKMGIPYDITPGVSSFCAAAASAQAEYTLPGISQSVILTRMEGRTPVPEREKIASLASHGTSMVIFLSAGTYTADTPACIVYKASWPEEKVLPCTVGTLASVGQENAVGKTALILIGDFLNESFDRSCLYDPSFCTGFREKENAK